VKAAELTIRLVVRNAPGVTEVVYRPTVNVGDAVEVIRPPIFRRSVEELLPTFFMKPPGTMISGMPTIRDCCDVVVVVVVPGPQLEYRTSLIVMVKPDIALPLTVLEES
jgi:hypothetical protein